MDKLMSKHKQKISISLLIVALAIPITILALPQKTQIEQHASQVENLNSVVDIWSTNNPDGTMGPDTSDGNFSNTLSPSQLGDLTVFLMDNVADGETGPQNANVNAGPQPVTSLQVTVWKIEVHLTSLQGADQDRWETLAIGNPKVIDLAQLQHTNTLESFGFTHLASGSYSEIRLYVNHAIATLENGQVVRVSIDGHDGIIAIKKPFSIATGRTTNLTVNMDATHSVIKADDRYLLKPVVVQFLNNQ